MFTSAMEGVLINQRAARCQTHLLARKTTIIGTAYAATCRVVVPLLAMQKSQPGAMASIAPCSMRMSFRPAAISQTSACVGGVVETSNRAWGNAARIRSATSSMCGQLPRISARREPGMRPITGDDDLVGSALADGIFSGCCAFVRGAIPSAKADPTGINAVTGSGESCRSGSS